MKGYDGDPEGTALVIKEDGWLHTGDLGVMREDGCIHITGRSRDVIIRGGENIYPREVEEFLYTHPKVDEVQVVGIPNARLGEIVVAWVRLRPGIDRNRRRDSPVLPGPDRLLQDSRARPLRGLVPRNALRQDPEVQDARIRDRSPRSPVHRQCRHGLIGFKPVYPKSGYRGPGNPLRLNFEVRPEPPTTAASQAQPPVHLSSLQSPKTAITHLPRELRPDRDFPSALPV